MAKKFQGIDQYGDKRTAIATPDQLKKAKAILEPVTINLRDHGLVMPSKEDFEDIVSIRKLLLKTQDTLKTMTEKAGTLERDRSRAIATLEAVNHRFQCPYLQGVVTFVECQKSCSGGYCPKLWHCESRITELKKFLLLP